MTQATPMGLAKLQACDDLGGVAANENEVAKRSAVVRLPR